MIAVPWYETADDYNQMLSLADDLAALFKHYQDWYHEATRLTDNLSRSGYQVLKVPYRVREWAKWCADQGISKDENSRSEFVAKLAVTEKLAPPRKIKPSLFAVPLKQSEHSH
jgi:hypothetical protein